MLNKFQFVAETKIYVDMERENGLFEAQHNVNEMNTFYILIFI